MDRKSIYTLGVVFFIILQVCNSVKITNLEAPDVVIINEKNQDPVILDCEYDINLNEKGFVLKWLLDGSPIYQWIPSRAPFALKSFKDHVDVSYEASPERNQRHRALVITRPLWNFTGEYLCNVQTYESNDKRSKKIQFIQPEQKFEASFDNIDDQDAVVRCTAIGIAPQPNITLYIDNVKQVEASSNTEQENGLFNTITFVRVTKNLLKEGSNIQCVLTIPGTDYTKTKDIAYSNSSSTRLATSTTILISILAFFISKL